MHAATTPHTIRLSRPWLERIRDAAFERWARLRRAWQRRADERQRERETQAVADMNELLLRDIGAPESLVAQAAARRDAARLVERELWRENAIGRLRGLQ